MRIKVFGLLLPVLLLTGRAKAVDPLLPHSARSVGMSGANVVLTDHWTGFCNPAGIAAAGTPTAGISYINYYLVPEMGTGSLSGIIPTRTGNFGLDYASTGNKYFATNHAGVVFGRAIGKKIRTGIEVNYILIRQPKGYGNLYAFVPSVGIQFLPSENILAGVMVFNPAKQKMLPAGEISLPFIIRAGIGYRLGRELMICLEAEKRSEEKMSIHCGTEISFSEKIKIRLGGASGTYTTCSFGAGFRFGRMNIDLGVSRHPVLGFSPCLSIVYFTQKQVY